MILDEELKEVILKYKLTAEDIYRHDKDLILVSQKGIRKIISETGLSISKRIEFNNETVAVICRAEAGNSFGREYKYFESIGEASPRNTTFKFPIAVAEARSQSRAVLSFVGLYEKGIIGENELDLEVEGATILQKRKEQAANATELLLKKIGKNAPQ